MLIASGLLVTWARAADSPERLKNDAQPGELQSAVPPLTPRQITSSLIPYFRNAGHRQLCDIISVALRLPAF
jgi:hypothetical protein